MGQTVKDRRWEGQINCSPFPCHMQLFHTASLEMPYQHLALFSYGAVASSALCPLLLAFSFTASFPFSPYFCFDRGDPVSS